MTNFVGVCRAANWRIVRHPGEPGSRDFLSFFRVGMLLGLLCLPSIVHGDETGPVGDTVDLSRLRGINLEGKRHEFSLTPDGQGTVFVFLSTECPISNGCVPRLNRLASRFRKLNVEFCGVISSSSVTRAEAIRHRDEFRIAFPVLFDVSGELRRLLRATHTPQAIVVSPGGRTLYSGRVDNQYSAVGRRRDQPSVHDLRDALQSIISGREVAVPVTEPVGCLLEDPPQPGAGGAVTFNRDIAPVLFTSCSECHRPGETAPFSLLSYEDASRHAQQIVQVTQSRFMPPWHPVEGFGHFQNERRLSDGEIALFQQWVADGKPEGDVADRLTPPEFPGGWRLGTPDLVLRMDEAFELEADGQDVHQHFVLPTRLKENRLVAAIEFRPGNSTRRPPRLLLCRYKWSRTAIAGSVFPTLATAASSARGF